eukprot:11685285-Ditylum_brightwellii.AAC.1
MAPTSSPAPLGPDPQGKGPQYEHLWKCSSVLGMLMYLASNRHPEISFAVQQCARHLLPLKNLVIELLVGMGLDSRKLKFNSKSTVYEDNNGAIRLATCPKLTPT